MPHNIKWKFSKVIEFVPVAECISGPGPFYSLLHRTTQHPWNFYKGFTSGGFYPVCDGQVLICALVRMGCYALIPIWAMNSNNDYVENMVAYIRRYAAEYFENSPVKLKITMPDNINYGPISNEKRRNLFYAVKEALHNIIKHAKASDAEMHFDVKNDLMFIIIQDNGIGILEKGQNTFGNGIRNMKNRMKAIHGDFNFENNIGTKITFTMPI